MLALLTLFSVWQWKGPCGLSAGTLCGLGAGFGLLCGALKYCGNCCGGNGFA